MEQNWNDLKNQCMDCRACGLCETRHNVVFGVGNPQAEILFIGEGPGENEDLQGEPFVGRAGKLLDVMLEAVGFSRKQNIYIANMVKCRPPQNRDPLPEEQQACAHWLAEQIRLMSPKIVVCLGRIAAFHFISPDFKVTRQHGQFIEKDGVLYMGMFHPAAILRNPNQKPVAFEDFVKLRDKVLEICTRTTLNFDD